MLSVRKNNGVSNKSLDLALAIQKFCEDDGLKKLKKYCKLSQHVMCFSNAAGIHGVFYRTWWCELSDGVQK